MLFANRFCFHSKYGETVWDVLGWLNYQMSNKYLLPEIIYLILIFMTNSWIYLYSSAILHLHNIMAHIILPV